MKVENLENVMRQLLRCDCVEAFGWWLNKDDSLRYYINCNDLFSWGCSDVEELTNDNFHLLQEAIDALGEEDCFVETLATDLFCARARKCKPQRPWFHNRREYFQSGLLTSPPTVNRVDEVLSLFDVDGWGQYS